MPEYPPESRRDRPGLLRGRDGRTAPARQGRASKRCKRRLFPGDSTCRRKVARPRRRTRRFSPWRCARLESAVDAVGDAGQKLLDLLPADFGIEPIERVHPPKGPVRLLEPGEG